MSVPEQPNWDRLVAQSQEPYLSPPLKKAVTFIIDSRVPGAGWGPLPGMKSDLYHTAKVIECLGLCSDKRISAHIADASAHHRQNIESPGQLKIKDLASLISIVRAEETPDVSLLESCNTALEEKMEAIDWERYFSIPELFEILQAVHFDLSNDDIYSRWLRHGLELQSHEDGGWPLLRDGESSLLATTAAVDLFDSLNDQKTRAACEKGYSFLLRSIIPFDDFFQEQGSILLTGKITAALAGSSLSYTELRRFRDYISEVQNPDGGWGTTEEDPSNLEVTAVCVNALAKCGDNSVVPSRLALAALDDVQVQVSQIKTERDRLSKNLELEVQQRCGRVRRERDELRSDKVKLEKQLARQQALLEEISSTGSIFGTSLENSGQFWGNIGDGEKVKRQFGDSIKPYFIGALGALAISTILWYFSPAIATFERGYLVGTAIALLLLFGAVLYRWLAARRSRSGAMNDFLLGHSAGGRDLTVSPSHLRRMRLAFSQITSDLSPSMREELLYRVFRDVSSLPKDVGIRYLEDMFIHLPLPDPNTSRRLMAWMRRLLELSDEERALLLEQIRRAMIR